jgi:hypothetical protein
MTLIDEAELGGKPCQVGLPAGKALQRRTHAESQAVAGDGCAGRRAEDPAQMVW